MTCHGNVTLTLRQRHELVLEIEAVRRAGDRPPVVGALTRRRP
jgi:hypothetical protein